MAAHVLNLQLQLALAALLGALCIVSANLWYCSFDCGGWYLEGKVLEEVCGAIGLVRLSAASGVYPDTNGRGLGVWGVLGGDLSGLSEGYKGGLND